MRKKVLREGFCLSGRIPGAVKPDVVKEVNLPFLLQDEQDECGQEGLFLRQWNLHALLEKPEEPPHSHAERTLLTLDGVYGTGDLYIGDQHMGALLPHMELDVTEALRSGCTGLRLHFPPQHPQLLAGERGSELVVQGGLISAMLRNIFHLKISSVQIEQDGQIRIAVYAYGAGRVRLCLRLMQDDKLLFSENCTVRVQVGAQEFVRHMDTAMLRGGEILRVTADMGGEGCDACETVYSAAKNAPAYIAHFRALPDEAMLKAVHSAGFDGIVLYTYPHEHLRRACDALGLHAEWEKGEIRLRNLLITNEEYKTDEEGCLSVPMRTEEERMQYRQAQRLMEAVLARRAAGKPVQILALCRQKDAQDGLFDAQGNPRMAMYAMRTALSRIALYAEGEKRLYHPCETFDEEIILLCHDPDGAPAAVQAELFSWDGTEIISRVFPICIRETVQRIGRLQARLPWQGMQGLLLRMQCIREGRILAVGHAYYPCADENSERIPFPEADIAECVCGDARQLRNVSDAVAMGVSVVCGEKVLISHGAMLPQERIALAQTGDIMVQYGNAVRKGGKNRVVQRVLRGVFGDRDTAPVDP